MTHNTILMILAGCEIAALIGLTISQYITAKLIGKKFDALLIKNNIKLPPVFNFFPGRSDLSLRAEKYADCILSNKNAEWRKKKPKDWYESFDFRSHASKRDMWVAYSGRLIFYLVFLILLLMVLVTFYYKMTK